MSSSVTETTATASAEKPRLLFVNRSYWPDTEATGQLLTELCEDLAATAEFDVHVLCGQPNHISIVGGVNDPAAAFHNGVTIHRVAHSQFDKHRTIGKLANLVSFTLAAWRWTKKIPRADVVITETDPFFLGLLGQRLQKKWRCRFVAYLQDIYPDIAVAAGKLSEGAIARQIRGRLFGAYRAADQVIVLSRDMLETCVRHGVAPERLEVIPNWADVQSLRPIKEGNAFRRHHGLDGKFVVMYSGNMGVPHLLTPMLDVAERFRGDDSVVFYFVGGGVQKTPIEQEAASRGLTNVRVLPYQPKAELSQSLSAADVQLVSVKPGVIACLMPSKVYGILAAGCAVLAIAPRTSELGEMILDNQFGEVCDPDSPKLVADLTAAVTRLRSRADVTLPARAHEFVVRTAAKDPQVAKFRNLLLRHIVDGNRMVAVQGTQNHSSSREAAATAR